MNNSVIQLILNAGYIVKAVLVILMSFSIISWAIIFFKQNYFSKANKESDQFQRAYRSNRDPKSLFQATRNLMLSPISNVFKALYTDEAKKDKDLMYLIITSREAVRKTFAPTSPSFFILLVGIIQVIFLLITMYKFSRYYLILIPFFIMLILEATRYRTIQKKIFASLVFSYALFSLAVTQDVLSWNQCKWQLAQNLLDRGISPRKISAGFAWDAWQCSQYSLDHPYEIAPQNGDVPWWIEKLTPAVDPCYLISNSPVPTGFEVLSYFETDRYAVVDAADYVSRC